MTSSYKSQWGGRGRVDLLIYVCVRERGTVSVLTVTAAWAFLCDYTTTFQLTYLTDVFHKLDPFSGFAVPLFIYTHTHRHMHKSTHYFASHSLFFFLSSLCLPLLKKFSLHFQVKHLGQLISSGTRLAGYCWQDVWARAVYSVGIPNIQTQTQTCINTHTQTSSTHKMSVLTLNHSLTVCWYSTRLPAATRVWQIIDLYFCIVRVRLYFQVRDTANTTLNIWLNATFNILKRLQKQKRGDKS